MKVDVTTHYLEMIDPNDLVPKRIKLSGLETKKAEVPLPELNRFFYTASGGDWYWTDRLNWTYRQWQQWVDRPELHTWIAYVSGKPAGYFELEVQPDRSVLIAFLGLFPVFFGKGLGGHLLTVATEKAWNLNTSRVWVRTCTLDHPGALANYRTRGFRVSKEKVITREVPEHPPGPWPGADRIINRTVS